jgi:hypothetical protein
MRKGLLAAPILALVSTVALADIKLPEPSPEATVSQEIGISKVTLVYHRPAVKGRNVWTDLVPPGKVWRLGANDATTLELTHDAKINGNVVPAGKYALFAIPNQNEWTVVVNKQHKQWGAYFYKADQDLVRFNVKPQAAEFREYFDIDLVPVSESALRADIQWEKVRVPFTIEFDVNTLVWKQIDSTLATARADDWQAWHQAARYAMNTGQRLNDALVWIDKAMTNESFWNYELKALLLHKLGRTAEALPLMEKAKQLAAGKAPPEYIQGLDKTVASWK